MGSHPLLLHLISFSQINFVTHQISRIFKKPPEKDPQDYPASQSHLPTNFSRIFENFKKEKKRCRTTTIHPQSHFEKQMFMQIFHALKFEKRDLSF